MPQDLLDQPEPNTSGFRRSARVTQPPAPRLIEALEDVQIGNDTPKNFVAYEALYEPNISMEIEDQDPLLVFSSAYIDTMSLHEAMWQPDEAEFRAAVQREVQSFDENKQLEIGPSF
jgi:hypothetical protein